MRRRSKPKPKRPFLSRSVHPGGRVFWNIRSGDRGDFHYGKRIRPAYPVLVKLGRVPDDPDRLREFIMGARLALLRHGIVEAIKKGIKPVRHQPIESVLRKYLPPPDLPSGSASASAACPTADHQGLGSSRVDRADRTGWGRFGNPNPRKPKK